MTPIDIVKIYKSYLERQSEIDLKAIRKKMPETSMYSASSAGMCSRKIYYKSIEKATKTEEISDRTMRIFRLGNLIHRDLQDALKQEYVDSCVKRKEPKENK